MNWPALLLGCAVGVPVGLITRYLFQCWLARHRLAVDQARSRAILGIPEVVPVPKHWLDPFYAGLERCLTWMTKRRYDILRERLRQSDLARAREPRSLKETVKLELERREAEGRPSDPVKQAELAHEIRTFVPELDGGDTIPSRDQVLAAARRRMGEKKATGNAP